jgi:hypothetical protein
VSDTTINGTVRFNPRLAGTSCYMEANIASGVTVTNHGHLIFGSSAKPTDPWVLAGAGSLVNAADGKVTVDGTVSSYVTNVRTDGTFVVDPTGVWTEAYQVFFELRDGTLVNHGTFNAGGYSTFREFLGTQSGSPISLIGGRLELLGPGKSDYLVPPAQGAYLQNASGNVVVYPDQTITVQDGTLSTVGPVENRGLIALTGRGDGYASVGTYGYPFTNHGRIVFSSTPGTGTGGIAQLNQDVVNESDGVETAYPGRTCQLALGHLLNKGLIDVQETCLFSSIATLDPASVLRVHSSATRLPTIEDVRSGSVMGGTLDVVTDSADPPAAGAPRDLLNPRSPQPGAYHTIGGSFDALQGAVSSTLGYALSYPTDRGRHVQLQVVPIVRAVTASGLTAPSSAAVGDDATVAWTTTLSAATTTPFTDTVLLSSGPVPDASSVVLGRVEHTGSTPGGTAVPSSLVVRLPAGSTGHHYVTVVADAGQAIAASDRSGSTTSTPIELTATDLPADGNDHAVAVGADGVRTAGTGTSVLDGSRLLSLTGSSEDLVVTVTPGSAVVALAATGRVPTEGDYDVRGSGGKLLLPRVPGGSARYLLLRNSSGSPASVTVNVSVPGVSIASVSPTSVLAGSPAKTPVHLVGTGFTSSSAATLDCGGTAVQPASTTVESRTSLTSVFQLPTALGSCDVIVGSTTKRNAFSVDAPPSGVNLAALEARIDVVAPAVVRTGVDNRLTVRWTNDTGFSLPAPLFQVRVSEGTIRFPDTPANGSSRVDVLGISPSGQLPRSRRRPSRPHACCGA